MILELDGNALAWYLAVVITLHLLVLWAQLTALRYMAAKITPLIPKIEALMKRYGGEPGGGGGGALGGLDIGSLVSGLFGGKK
jgi:hypothetical protein